jgi:hypothetical protein
MQFRQSVFRGGHKMSRVVLWLLLSCLLVPSSSLAQTDSLCDEKVFDDGTIGNSFYFSDSSYIMARRFVGSSSPVGMEWGEINTLSYGEPYFPWPDADYDSFEISVWEEEPGSGLPKFPAIWSIMVFPTDSPAAVRVYPPDTVISATNIIFLGMRNPKAPDHAEGLNTDVHRDSAGTIISSDFGVTWSPYTPYGDWHIRACLIYPQSTQEAAPAPAPLCRLSPAIPNPFQSSTALEYSVPCGGRVNMRVFDLAGRCVNVLVDGYVSAGSHVVTWDGSNQAGEPVSSGVYLCRMEAGRYVGVEKLVCVRERASR